MELIGLNGFKEAGKDTAYKLLQELGEAPMTELTLDGEPRAVVREGFADRLKLSAARALGVPEATLDDQGIEEAREFCDLLKQDGYRVVVEHVRRPAAHVAEVTGREFLQYYGTEAHRDVFDQDFWIRAVIDGHKDDNFGRPELQMFSDRDVLVITDVRFPNEAQAVQDAGGYVWRIDRTLTSLGDPHASEKPLPMELVDLVIDNNHDLDALKANLGLGFEMMVQGKLDEHRGSGNPLCVVYIPTGDYSESFESVDFATALQSDFRELAA